MPTQPIGDLVSVYRDALLDDVVPFWERHSPDPDRGGFFTMLDRSGQRYGDDKPIWLQGRAIWLFATLYRLVEPRPQWLELAQRGREFLDRHAFAPDGKMYFSVTHDGKPLQMRRYVFCEVFAVMAYGALALATDDETAREQARRCYRRFVEYITTPGKIAPKIDTTTRPMKGLSPLMCWLSLAEMMRGIDPTTDYDTAINRCVDEILTHFVDHDRRCVLETVAPDGGIVDGPDGRVMNPGHAIECAWFMLDIAQRRGDGTLVQRVLPIVDYALERGWDTEHGGLLYFVDIDGRPPVQLEHDMKLWWPHNEALIALLYAYRATGEQRYADDFLKVHEWTFNHFPDREHGEWFGYLHRDGSLSTPLKGGTWKGPFHVPRCLLLCWRALEALPASSAR